MNETDKKALEVLEHMKENLFERGWCQGQLELETGEVCLSGALATLTNYEEYYALFALSTALDSIHKAIGGASIPGWNDEPGRTFNEVIEVIDKAAIIIKEGNND